MIALDTNVLVRLVTRDNEAQALRAKAVFDAHSEAHGGLFVSDIVLVELCWTLSRSYELNRVDIARTVRALIDNGSIAFESQLAVRNALSSFETTTADFPDCLIVAKANQVGCGHTLTFDRRMKSLPSIQLL